jgi:hypothetical protein
LHIRSPINLGHESPYYVQEAILETDWLRFDVWLNLGFREKGVPVSLRRHQWPPIAQLVPVKREVYDSRWHLSEQLVHRNDAAGIKVFQDWVRYNYNKFLNLSPTQVRDPSTYHRERSRFLRGRNAPNPQIPRLSRDTRIESIADIASGSLLPGGLFDKAEELLCRKLEQYPDDVHANRMLAHMYRAQGKLAAALATYQRVCENDQSDVLSRQLCAILAGSEELDRPRSQLCPAPFVVTDGHLPSDQHEEILHLACEHIASMHPARVGDDHRVDVVARSSWRLLHNTLELKLPWFAGHIKSRLESVVRQLGMRDFDCGEIELQMIAHLSGGFYKIHRDNSGDSMCGRTISFSYYFYRQPKSFSGGDLLLYDTDLDTGKFGATFTRIVPDDNRIVFFPSSFCHQVTTVRIVKPDATFGRFALTGWVHAPTSRAAR